MPRLIHTRIRVLVALLLATAVWTADARPLSADCVVLDMNGLERDCTLTEEFGQCGSNAQDSYWQCVHGADEEYDRHTLEHAWAVTKCELGLYFDMTGCVLATPFRTILM